MAKTAADPFDLTLGAKARIVATDAVETVETAETAPKPVSAGKREFAKGSGTSLYLYEDQAAAIRTAEYRQGKRINVSKVLRAALDEYLLAHGADMLLDDSDLEVVRAGKAIC